MTQKSIGEMEFKEVVGLVKITPAVMFLIVVNFIPVFGIVLFGWDVATIMALYWLENIVIGAVNIPKMWACEGGVGEKIFVSCFFAFHYGFFCWGHMMFLNDMFDTQPIISSVIEGGPVTWTVLSLAVSHLFSTAVNFFGKKEYEDRKVSEQMFFPYGRIVAMHIVIIIGGMLVLLFKAPIIALILLVTIKTVMDIAVHTIEHSGRKLSKTPLS